MKKKDTGKAIIILIATVALLGAGAYFSGIGGLRKAEIVASGLSIDAISLAYPPVQGQPNEWVVSAHATGFGQSIVGNLNSKDIIYQGVSAKYPLSITGEVSENKGLYLIDNANPKTIYKYTVTETHGSLTNYYLYVYVTPPANCEGTPSYTIPIWSSAGWFGASSANVANICVYKNNAMVEAPIKPFPNIYPKISVNVNINGQTQSVVLDSIGAKSLPNNLGSVAWTNSPLQSGTAGTLSQSSYAAVAPFNTENWRVVYANDYSGSGIGQSWKDTADKADSDLYLLTTNPPSPSGLQCTPSSFDNNGLIQISTCVKNYITSIVSSTNNLADKLYNSNLNINSATTSYSSQEKGFWVDLGKIYATAPQLQFRIKSDWLGIIFPSGAPQVISAEGTPKPFRSGEPLTINIKVKNIGDGNGNFAVQGLTGGTLALASQVYPTPVPSGGTADIQFTMVTSGKQSETGTLTGKIVDTGSLKEASFSVQYSMEVPAQCTVGKTYWSGGNAIQICDSTLKKIDYKTCEYGVVGDGQGGWKCGDNPNPGGTPSGTPTPTTGSKGLKTTGTTVKWYETPQAAVLAILGILTAGAVLMRLKRKK